MKRYTVNDGHSLLMPDGSVIHAGESLELDDALAQVHAERVTLVDVPSSAVPAEKPSKAPPLAKGE